MNPKRDIGFRVREGRYGSRLPNKGWIFEGVPIIGSPCEDRCEWSPPPISISWASAWLGLGVPSKHRNSHQVWTGGFWMSRGFSIIVSCNAPGNLQPECLQLLSPFPKLTASNTWKLMVGRPLLFWGGEMGRWPIFGAMLVLESVIASLRSTSIKPLLIDKYMIDISATLSTSNAFFSLHLMNISPVKSQGTLHWGYFTPKWMELFWPLLK